MNLNNFSKNDDYFTPKHVWEDIKQFIPKNKIIWEPFYGDGKSGEYLQQMGFDVVHEPIDFFQNNKGEVIVTNPPFSTLKRILERLKEIDKPFILLLPTSKICNQYFKIFQNEIKLIIPKRRINFNSKHKHASPYDCFYYCYKINDINDITWL
jgi:hypothetical protein